MLIQARAALFDMDGTLVDSTAVVERLWEQFAIEQDRDVAEITAFAHGRPTRDTIEAFVRKGEPAEVLREFEHLELTIADGIQAVPGAAHVLQQLRDAPVAVVTSASTALAEFRMSAVGLSMPGVVVTADHVARGKPDPEPYLRAAEKLSVPIEHCVVFEDAPAGIRSALAAGARPIVVGQMPLDGSADGLPRIADFTALQSTLTDGVINFTFVA